MARNYYAILGIDPDASPDQIRSAYRRKAKELHPDHYEGGSEPFRDVQQAYEALSDPKRRQCYDARLERERHPGVASRRTDREPLRSRWCPVEPLIPGAPSFVEDKISFGPSGYTPFAESLGRLWEEWESTIEPLGQAREEAPLVISLTRAQALRGGRVRVEIAVPSVCPNCRGYGSIGVYECGLCAGRGTIVEQQPVWLVFPAGVSDHSIARISLAQLGLPDVDLVVRFRVRG